MKVETLALIGALTFGNFFAIVYCAEAKSQSKGAFEGGRVTSASCDLGRNRGEGFVPDGMYCSFAIEPVSLAENLMIKPKSITITVFTTVRTKSDIVTMVGRSRGGAEINPSFVAVTVEGRNLLPETLAPGRYELIVMVIAQADNGPPCLLDVHTSHFRIPDDRREVPDSE